MKPPFLLPSNHSTPALPFILPCNVTSPILNSLPNSTLFLKSRYFPLSTFNRRLTLCSSNSSAELSNSDSISEQSYQFVEIANPNVSPFLSSWRSKFSLSDQASFLFTFIACTVIHLFYVPLYFHKSLLNLCVRLQCTNVIIALFIAEI